MATMVVTYRQPQDREAFDRHYIQVHVLLAKKLPGLRRYEISKGPIITPGGDSDVYFIATLFFDDMASIQNAFASAEGQACAVDRRLLAPLDDDAQIFLFETQEV